MEPGLVRDFLLGIPEDTFRLVVVLVALWLVLMVVGLSINSHRGGRP